MPLFFRKYEQAKRDFFYKKNELSEAVARSTKADSSETTQDPTPRYLCNCCHNDLLVSYIAEKWHTSWIGPRRQQQQKSLTRGDNCLRTLPFEERCCECACALTTHEGHIVCPESITMKALGKEFQENLSKSIKTLLSACYKDLGNVICELLLSAMLDWLHCVTTFMHSHHHNFKIFELLFEICDDHVILQHTLFLSSKIAHDHHKMSISPFPMSSRNESAKIISCLSDRIARVENKTNAVLMNSNSIHDMMWSVIG